MEHSVTKFLTHLSDYYKKSLVQARLDNDNSKDVYLDALEKLNNTIDFHYQPIAEGSCRRVYRIGDYALKVATSMAGLAQNQVECKVEPSEFINKIYRKDKHDLPAWILTDYCKPATKYHIRKTLKVTPKTFDAMVTAKRFNTVANKDYLRKMSKHKVATQYINLMAKYDLLGGDIMSHRLENYGVNPKGELVLIDYGLDGKVWDKYY